MKGREPKDRLLRDLMDIVHFTENLSTKIHGLLNEADVYRTVRNEFARSKRYTASILLLTDDGSKLRIAETSLPHRKLREGEKSAGVRLKAYKIDLDKSNIYSQVVREGKTVQTCIADIMGELFPRPIVYLISKAMDYENKSVILTPLNRQAEVIGVFAMSSPELSEYFIQSVKCLAHHISVALELAIEYAERRRAEEELIHLSSAVRMSTDSIVTSDLAAKIIDANPATLCMYGTNDKSDLVGRNSFDLIAPEDREKALAGMNEVLKRGYAVSREYQVITKDGSRIPVEMNTAIMKDGDGKPTGFVSISRDITKRRKAEEDIKNYEKRIESLINSSRDLIFLKDREFRYLVANEAHEKLFGVKLKDIIGKTDFDFMPKSVAEGCRESDMETLKSGFVSQEEFLGERCFEVVKQRVVDAKGRVVGIAGVIRDITKRKQAEEALRESQKALSEQNLLLQEKNIALREVMGQVKAEKERIESQVRTNVDQLLLPLLAKLTERGSQLDKTYIGLLGENLKELTSSFGSEISSRMLGLTQREIEICNMIRSGLSSKEIARLLHISCLTAESHRKNIRSKLGIRNKAINLTTYLQGL